MSFKNKLFKGCDHDGKVLLILAAPDEDTCWVYSQGAKLPIHSFSEVDINMNRVVKLAEAESYDTQDMELLYKRTQRNFEPFYILK